MQDEDQGHGLELLQRRGSPLTGSACPVPDEAEGFSSIGKGCPDSPEASVTRCLDSNYGYRMIEDAWERCGKTEQCGAVMQSTDGLFYLRRTSDPDLELKEGVKMFTYTCKAADDSSVAHLADHSSGAKALASKVQKLDHSSSAKVLDSKVQELDHSSGAKALDSKVQELDHSSGAKVLDSKVQELDH